MPTLETATMVRQKDQRLQAAMHALLHRLRRFVRALPMTPDTDLPEHDIVWTTEVDRSPNGTIIEMIKAHPELWVEALPPECCIVHRETLKKYVGADATEYMESHGANAVATQAARVLYEMEARERRERYSQAESN
jgi:hypothetical protein